MNINNEFTVIYELKDFQNAHSGCPGITILPSGRLVCTFNVMGYGEFDEPYVQNYNAKDPSRFVVGKVYTSDDKGQTWIFRTNFPFFHARPFVAGNELYIIGHCGDLKIIKSSDEGDTWSEAFSLSENQSWHQTAANVCYKNENIYLVMEREKYDDCKAWAVSVLAPVVMKANIKDDLCDKNSWTFSDEVAFRDIIDQDKLDYFGVPFFSVEKRKPMDVEGVVTVAPLGWLETNIVQIYDKNHYWYDENTFYLLSRAHTGGTGYCAISKAVENKDGSIKIDFVRMPSGVKAAFLPMPGGHMRFHILYDEETKLYWLLSTQATDSMTKASALPEGRFNLPNNERNRLQLHFSKNCVDWCFAAIVSIGENVKESRHYASMVIDGENLYVVSRSGNKKAKNPHDVNMITFHCVENFRKLVY